MAAVELPTVSMYLPNGEYVEYDEPMETVAGSDAWYVVQANRAYGSDDVEIDHTSAREVSRTTAPDGAWVKAWLWVAAPENLTAAAPVASGHAAPSEPGRPALVAGRPGEPCSPVGTGVPAASAGSAGDPVPGDEPIAPGD